MGTHANANFLLPAWDSGPEHAPEKCRRATRRDWGRAMPALGPDMVYGSRALQRGRLVNHHLGKLPTALLAHGNKTEESQSLQGSCPISKITKCSWQTRVPAVLRHVQRKEVAL